MEQESNFSYSRSMEEIDALIAEINSDKLDIDLLVGKVRRASELIRQCREHLEGIDREITEIISEGQK